jgi:FkbM family methyltransferase
MNIESIASQCSWVNLYHGLISKEINLRDYRICVEIGVAYGFHADNILKNTTANYIGIDPYKAGYDDTDIFSQDLSRRLGLPAQAAMDILHDHVKKKLQLYPAGRADLIRKTSTDGLGKIDDESVDLIFVDGNHTYDCVLADLKLAWKKIRGGGCLCGDDFNQKEVERAVRTFAQEQKLEFVIKTKESQTYPIFFFYKPLNFVRLPSYSLPDHKGLPIDHKLIEIMKGKRDGIFIEAGANDGITQSNTKLLEDHFGWSGLLVEPSPALSALVKKNRGNCKIENCALVSYDYKGDSITGDFDGHLMSSVNGARRNQQGTITIPAVPLGKLLSNHKIQYVELFSLDVEGYELEVLKGIDFTMVKFEYLLIEVYNKDKDSIVDFLRSKGYSLHSNISGYNKQDNPVWDGTHNDYLFVADSLKKN